MKLTDSVHPPQVTLKPKKLKVGVIDLVASQPTRSIYSKIANPNYTSIMPQFLSVWLEELGHDVHYVTYTGFEDLADELPTDVDAVFISCFTQAAYMAYAIANIFRKRGVVTILGGPHARAFAEDARYHFDYVLGLTDKPLIKDLLSDLARQPKEGLLLSANQQPKSLPTLRQRWKFVQHNLAKTKFVHSVPMIASLGCPYTCNFCIDSQIAYQPQALPQLREDLLFLQSLPKPPMVGWYDPNFGVRFDAILNTIEETVKPGTIGFAAESSLSLLCEDHLKRLKKNNFLLMLPGVESWFAYGNKSKQSANTGEDKVKLVAEQINLVLRYIPYVQANLIFGLDCDEGPTPFELSKRFVDLAPGVYPNFSLITSYGNSAPLSHTLQEENRVLDLPFPFLDGNSGLNIKLKNYEYLDFYRYMDDLVKYAFSKKKIAKRFVANKHAFPRWINLLRSVFSAKGSCANFAEISNLLQNNSEFQGFYFEGNMQPPSFYRNKVEQALGSFYQHLPTKVINYLHHGEAAPNERISNALNMEKPSMQPGMARAVAAS